jgi:hypothetical protein
MGWHHPAQPHRDCWFFTTEEPELAVHAGPMSYVSCWLLLCWLHQLSVEPHMSVTVRVLCAVSDRCQSTVDPGVVAVLGCAEGCCCMPCQLYVDT